MRKAAPYKSSRDFLERNGLEVGKKSTKEDLRIAYYLTRTIRNLEKFIFEEQVTINFFDEINSWGIEAVYHWQTKEYDIYVPGLAEKFKNIFILFPEKVYLNDLNKKLIFVASHKIRHRLQKEKNISLFTPDADTRIKLIDDIIEKVADYKNDRDCDCSVVEEKLRLKEVEFDARVIQHYSLTKLGCLNPYPVFNIPLYAWRSIAKDLLIEP